MTKKSVKKKVSKKKSKKETLVSKEARVITRLVFFVPILIIAVLLTWLLPVSTLETIFLGIAILSGIISATLILILAGIILARKKK